MVYNNNEAKDVIEVTNIAKVSRGDFNKSAEEVLYPIGGCGRFKGLSIHRQKQCL